MYNIIFVKEDNGVVKIPVEELRKLLQEVYHDGYSDGINAVSTTPAWASVPQYEYTISTADNAPSTYTVSL